MIFDTHIHWDDEAFDEDRDEMIAGLPEAGIACVNAAADLKSSEAAAALAARWPHVWAMAGVHPEGAADMDEDGYARLEGLLAQPRVVALGEIGLDRHWPEPPAQVQRDCFIRQLHMAADHGMPIAIHSREAAQDTLDIVRAEGSGLSGVMHCFSYGTDMAREWLDMGFYLGIGGVLTFKNGRKLKEVAAFAPWDRIVLETDAPYLAPEPYRGRRNSSYYLTYVRDALAQIKDTAPEEVERITWENAHRLYRIPLSDAPAE